MHASKSGFPWQEYVIGAFVVIVADEETWEKMYVGFNINNGRKGEPFVPGASHTISLTKHKQQLASKF